MGNHKLLLKIRFPRLGTKAGVNTRFLTINHEFMPYNYFFKLMLIVIQTVWRYTQKNLGINGNKYTFYTAKQFSFFLPQVQSLNLMVKTFLPE